MFLQRWLFKQRVDKVTEFWFGTDHEGYPDEGFTVAVSSRVANRIYITFAWLGFFGFILSLINLSLTVIRLLGRLQ